MVICNLISTRPPSWAKALEEMRRRVKEMERRLEELPFG
jgi:hypothetical protein